MAAPMGNSNAARGTLWRDAIRKALAKDKGALEKVAESLIAAAQDGDMQAIKKLGDRLDGKAVATVQGELTHQYVARLPLVAETVEEWQQRYLPPTIP
jgi:hypothetical protein